MNFDELYLRLGNTPAKRWLNTLPQQVDEALNPERHGRLQEWLDTIAAMPKIETSRVDLTDSVVRIGSKTEISDSDRMLLISQLQQLIPWRKGPFSLFGIDIDTEWRSDLKWDRLTPHISPLKGKWVLDVGCGSGYHCWRMLGEGASQVIGIDPTLLFNMQFRTINRFYQNPGINMLPLPMEALPENLCLFDTVFSMGVLYHRRSPIDHLVQLRDALKPGGELVLETLIVEGEKGYSLVPDDRYARMRNVWFLPSLPTLEHWLDRCGFESIKTVDVNLTSTEEQRSTEWMPAESLANTLDPHDRQKTVEGLPAPRRAMIIAKRKL